MLSPIQGFVTEEKTEYRIAAGREKDQLQPHNADAEWALLGGLIIDPDQMIEVGYLNPMDFFITNNRSLYQVLVDLFKKFSAYDFVTVCDEMENRGWLDNFGGAGGISQLIEGTPTSMNAPYYAQIVYRDSVRRQVINRCADIVQTAYDPKSSQDSEALVNTAMQAMADIDAVRNVSAGAQPVMSAVNTFMQKIEYVSVHGKVSGLETGLKDVDRLFGGFRPSKTYLLAGRPGMGKSGLSLQIAHNLAKKGKRILIFSLEMSSEDQVGRLISQRCKVPYEQFENGGVDDWSCVVQAADYVSTLPIVIDDTPALTMTTIRNIAQKEIVKNGLDLIIIDHMGITKSTANGGLYEQGSQRADDVMALSKQIGIPTLALVQLSRKLESRRDKRPIMSDLRDTGKWEENADGIIFIYRDDYYNDDTELPNIAEIIIAKNRGGKTGSVSVYADNRTAQYMDLEIRTDPLGYK